MTLNRKIAAVGSFCQFSTCLFVAALCLNGPVLVAQIAQTKEGTRALHDGWQIQSSCTVREKGEAISSATFEPRGWYPASVPGAVVTNLVADKVPDYPDPYTGMNLRKMPGVEYAIGSEFANQPIPENSPFHCSWWYRTTFTVLQGNKTTGQDCLNFQGINYRANI